MPTLDVVLLIVILLSALMGLTRGLLKEVMSLGTWIAAFVLAMYLAPSVADQLNFTATGADVSTVRLVLAFAAVFIAVLLLGGLVQWLVTKLVQTTGLSGTDRVLGFVFGGLRGAVICVVALIAVRGFAQDAPWWHESRLQEPLLAFEEDVLSFMGSARRAVWEAAGLSG